MPQHHQGIVIVLLNFIGGIEISEFLQWTCKVEHPHGNFFLKIFNLRVNISRRTSIRGEENLLRKKSNFSKWRPSRFLLSCWSFILLLYSATVIQLVSWSKKSFYKNVWHKKVKVKATFKPFCFISTDDGIAKELKEEIQNLSVKVENIEERLINHSK